MSTALIGKNKNYDWLTISVYFCLVFIGWLMLYSIHFNTEQPYAFLNPTTDIGRQTLWVAIALVAFIATLNIEWNFWNTLGFPIYVISIILLLLVLFLGTTIKGAKSWFVLGFFSFQPSEIAKFGTALALSLYMSSKKHNFVNTRVLLTTLGIFLLPILLILLQPDAGSAVVFLSFLILLYRKGFSPMFYFLSFVLLFIFILSFVGGTFLVSNLVWLVSFALLLFSYETSAKTIAIYVVSFLASFVFYNREVFIGVWLTPMIGTLVMMYIQYRERNLTLISTLSIFIALSLLFSFGTQYVFNNYFKPHQQDRINAWLQPSKCDPSGSLYNIIQSKLAIGSGGLTGKGYMQGEMTKLKYVPEQTSDFIFSTVGEEQGFLGVAGVIILFFILVVRFIVMAERARLEFIRNYLYCVAGIFFIHFFINIGMTMGVMPVIGIPLPFLSAGGSSLVSFSIMVGVAVKMDYYRMRSGV